MEDEIYQWIPSVTDRKDATLVVEAQEPHGHCRNCFRSRCQQDARSVRQHPSTLVCPVLSCAMCFVWLHQCKLKEHVQDICAEVLVPCINTGNGCDQWIKRKHVGRHLEMCPASIVFCSVEWNRWPLHYTDKHSPLPFFLPNAQGTPDQLDIALAIRDQSMLNAAYSAPRHFRKMRNELTERFPAVPLPTARQVPVAILKERQVHGQESQVSRDPSVESDSHPEEDFSWSDAPWQKRKNPPGLSRSLCSKLYQASRQTAESLKIALQMITENHGAHDEDDSFRDVDSLGDEEGARYEDGNMGEEKEYSQIDELIVKGSLDTGNLVSCRKDSSQDCVTDIEGEENKLKITEENDSLSSSSVPNPPPLHIPVSLGLNLTVETITRYQSKPKSMLTFVCGQTFRRNEYASHYKNVHSEIQGGITWFEQRCPLAQYGCPFSLRKIFPLCPDATVMHSADLQSFGIRRRDCKLLGGKPLGCDYLSGLPGEILDRIGQYLDGFALNNLSRVNRRLRQFCVGLLERQGMVQQEWIKVGRNAWKIGFQRWTFSTAFDQVTKWGFSHGSTGDHLRKCPFFHRVRHVIPIKLPIPIENSLHADQLIRMKSNAESYASHEEGVELIHEQFVAPCHDEILLALF